MKKKINISIITVLLALTACEQPTEKDEDTKLEHMTEETLHSIKKGDVEI